MKLPIALVASFVVAVVAESFMAGVYATLQAVILNQEGGGLQGEGVVFVTLGAAYVSAQIALPTVVLIALPYVLIARALGKSSLSFYALSGAVIGAVVCGAVLFMRLMHPSPSLHFGLDECFFVVSAIMSGAIAGTAFWKVVRPERAGLDTHNS